MGRRGNSNDILAAFLAGQSLGTRQLSDRNHLEENQRQFDIENARRIEAKAVAEELRREQNKSLDDYRTGTLENARLAREASALSLQQKEAAAQTQRQAQTTLATSQFDTLTGPMLGAPPTGGPPARADLADPGLREAFGQAGPDAQGRYLTGLRSDATAQTQQMAQTAAQRARMARVDALKPEHGVTIIAPFIPAPLIELLKSEGFQVSMEHRQDGAWAVSFSKT